MKIGFYLAHPAHFYLFKNIIDKLKTTDNEILIVIKKKDVLEELLSKSLTAFMVWFIENYPRSVKIMKDNPEYQYNFNSG